MEKLIAIPVARYKNLVGSNKPLGSNLPETLKAIGKNRENQQLLLMKRYYREVNEPEPKNLEKMIPKVEMINPLPTPPKQKKIPKKRYTKAEIDVLFGAKLKKDPVVKKPVIKKPVMAKTFLKPPELRKPKKFNLLDPTAFYKKKKSN